MALATLGGRIVAVSDGDELRRHLDAERAVSLQRRTVVSGFHDAHHHMPAFGLGLVDAPLSSPPVGSVEDILRAVKARAASQSAGSWVVGGGYDQNKLAVASAPGPTSVRVRPIERNRFAVEAEEAKHFVVKDPGSDTAPYR